MVFKKMRRARRFLRSKTSGRRTKTSGVNVNTMAIGSGVYGAARPFISNMVPDFAPLGAYSDNVVLGVAGYLAAKKGSGMIKQAGMVILANEAFILGAKLSQGLNSSPSNGGGEYL